MQKVYGGEKPVPLWLDENDDSNGGSSMKRILFSLNIRVKVNNKISNFKFTLFVKCFSLDNSFYIYYFIL